MKLRTFAAVLALLFCGVVKAQNYFPGYGPAVGVQYNASGNTPFDTAATASQIAGTFTDASCVSGTALLFNAVCGNFGTFVNNFGGLSFSLGQGSLGNPGGAMSGYATNDRITLQCTGVTFSSPPQLTVTLATAGAVTNVSLFYGGATNNAPPSGNVSCSQSSTSGSGTGYTVTAGLGLVATNFSFPSLNTGGTSGNGSIYVNLTPSDVPSIPAGGLGGSEMTLFGVRAGMGFKSGSFSDTALGHDACGVGSSFGAIAGGNSTCLGVDAGRNMSAAASQGNFTLVGLGAGLNIAGGWWTCGGVSSCGGANGNSAGQGSGNDNTAWGFQALGQLTSGGGNVGIGYRAGFGLTTANNSVVIQATNGSDNCSGAGNVSNYYAVCVGSTPVISVTGGGTPLTSNATVSGNDQINNKIQFSGTAPVVSACGTSPSIDAHATNNSGTVTVGTVAAATCTITFATGSYAFGTWNHCRVTSEGVVASLAYSYTLTAITVTATSLVGDKLDYDCDGL